MSSTVVRSGKPSKGMRPSLRKTEQQPDNTTGLLARAWIGRCWCRIKQRLPCSPCVSVARGRYRPASAVWEADPMSVTLRRLDARFFPAWLERSRDEYANDLVATGQTPEDAYRHADESMARSFPSGAPGPGHVVFDVVDNAGATVGYLWIGPDTSDDSRRLVDLGHRDRRRQAWSGLGAHGHGPRRGIRPGAGGSYSRPQRLRVQHGCPRPLRIARLRDDLGQDAQATRLRFRRRSLCRRGRGGAGRQRGGFAR